MNGATAWYDYQIDSNPLPSGCHIWVWRQKGGTGDPAGLMVTIDLSAGQDMTFQEDGIGSDKLVVHCTPQNKVTIDGPPPPE